jgi:hypothetical protein
MSDRAVLTELLEFLKDHKAHFYEPTWTERERRELMEIMNKGNVAITAYDCRIAPDAWCPKCGMVRRGACLENWRDETTKPSVKTDENVPNGIAHELYEALAGLKMSQTREAWAKADAALKTYACQLSRVSDTGKLENEASIHK